MNVMAMHVTFVEPDIAPARTAESRSLGTYEMAVVPRKGELVSLQTECGGARLPYRVMDVVYNMPDVAHAVGEDTDDQVVASATVVVCRIVSSQDLARAAEAAVVSGAPRQRGFFRGDRRA